VKPTSSIAQRQKTIDRFGAETEIGIVGRHDPCIAPRLLPAAEAMCALAIYDAWLSQKEISPEGIMDIGDYDWGAIGRAVEQASFPSSE
jgi:chorismate synthase